MCFVLFNVCHLTYIYIKYIFIQELRNTVYIVTKVYNWSMRKIIFSFLDKANLKGRGNFVRFDIWKRIYILFFLRNKRFFGCVFLGLISFLTFLSLFCDKKRKKR